MQDERKKLLGKVHIAKKDLGLDDDTYRRLLKNVTGRESASKCTVRQLIDVVKYMGERGWSENGKRPEKAELSPSVKKIYALWGVLQKLGKVKNRNPEILDRFVARLTKKSSVKALPAREAYKVIEALKKIIERAENGAK